MVTVLESIATGHPPYGRPQSEAADFISRVTSLPDRIRNRVPELYEKSAIEYRYSCISDYLRDDPGQFEFYPNNWDLTPAPTTEERNALYRRAVLPMAEQVARDAIRGAGLTADDITHVVAVSCTGFFAPGLDIILVKKLGLPATTRRALVGFMGCYAAFNGLRVADGFCKSQPGANVLLVCAELCTIHFQVSDSMEDAVINSLFSDGAAAAVLSSRDEADAHGKLIYADNASLIDDDSEDYMTWDIGNTGFKMGLSPRVPAVIAAQVGPFLDGLLGRNDLAREDVDFWGIHPGGRAIVERAQQALELSDEQVADSLDVLRLNGNMSSPTILFVLKRLLDQRAQRRDTDQPKTAIAMAFGPGLTLEGCLLRET
ncbi:MAG: type III polyketide synthase [Rhodothermales bacterium]|nr:type III polyketide synthase [Rhodothermales bacterium]